MSEECEHDWCYSPWVYLTYPPCYERICRICGFTELVRMSNHGENFHEFIEIKERFKERKESER